MLLELARDRRALQALRSSQGSQPQPGSQISQTTQDSRTSRVPGHPRQTSADRCDVAEGQANTVQPPRQSVETRQVGRIGVGGGHHLNQQKRSRRHGTKNQRIETEPASEEDEIPTKAMASLAFPPTNRHSSSPSPLPSSHRPVPIDPNIQDFFDNPFGDAARLSQATVASSAQPRLQSLRQQVSTGSLSLGGSPHIRSRNSILSNPSQIPPPSASQPDSQPIRPLRPRPHQSRREPGPSRPRGTSGQEANRARRLNKVPTAPQVPSKVPPAMNQALKLATARYRLRLEHERRRRSKSDSNDAINPTRVTDPVLLPAPATLLEDDEEARVQARAEAMDEEPKPKRKPKPAARDVHGNERHVLTVAKLHLFAYSVTEGAWQTRGLVTTWAHAIFQLSWEQEYPGLSIESPSVASIQCMVNSLPTFRGKTKEALRPFTEFYWGFKKPASTPEDIAHNIALAQKLLPNTFHCVSFDPPEGHYEGQALKLAIAIVLFANPTAVGITFRDYFEPVPEEAVAYTLANVQFGIEEFITGKFQARELNATEMLNKYVAHLRGLRTARRKAKARFKRLSQEWFDFGFDYSGALELDDPYTQAVTQASDVRPDTPVPDDANENDYLPESESEPESETEDYQRYSKRAKGKGNDY